MFLDPTGTITVALPPGWAFDPIYSSLTDLVFSDWSSPQQRQMFFHVILSHAAPGDSDAQWEAGVRTGLPEEATRVECREGPVVWVERPGREGRPDQRWAIVRGPRLDVVVEQVGVPLGSALTTPELNEALRTLYVLANHHLAEPHSESEMRNIMQAANQAFHAGDRETAAQLLSQAADIAKEAWLHSLTGRPLPEIPAAMAQADALLAMTHVTGSALFLYQATHTLYRAHASLLASSAPSAGLILKQLNDYLTQAMALHVETKDDNPPKNPLSACLVRSRLLLKELRGVLESDQSKIGGPWATLAIEDAMTAVAYARRPQDPRRPLPLETVAMLTAKGITDDATQQEVANEVVEIMALDHLVAAGASLQAARTFAGIDADRTLSANWLVAARRLAELSPTSGHDQSLVLALSSLAGAYVTLGDTPSLSEAEKLLAEAETILDRLGDEGELRAQISLNQGWLRYTRRQLDGSLDILDRALAAAQNAKSARLERAVRSLRSQFLGVAGRHKEAVAEARKALSDTHDDAASAHHLNLAVALHQDGHHKAALEEIRAGLAAALKDEPFGGEVLHLLYVGASVLETSNTAVSLAATEAAETVLDARRRRVGDAGDRVAFDDAVRHRDVAATLVQRRLEADDILGALATADRHRARSLAEASDDRSASTPSTHREPRPTPPADDATFIEQVAFLTQIARDTLARDGIPAPLDGADLADIVANSGRTAVLFHPSGNQLLIFVVKPGQSVGIVTAVADAPWEKVLALTDQLRSHLGIAVAAQAARGEFPPQSIEELTTALADNEAPDAEEQALNRLRRELHDALFSTVLPVLTDQEAIVVIPYRELAVIPLTVLTDHQDRPLVERHPVSVLPSLASLGALAQAKSDTPHAVLIGNPTLPKSSGLPPLPGAAAEARQIETMLREAGIGTQPLFDTDATEHAFRTHARGAHIVHLACHSALRQPASASPLFLCPSATDDGLLLPAEIADLRLDGALAVLSACQSGLGRTTADGVLGLGRAFIQAGARAVVLSLWRVDDAATAHMMQALYQGLLGTAPDLDAPLDLAAAMQRAQLTTRDNVSDHPSSWGPWMVVGDGGWHLA